MAATMTAPVSKLGKNGANNAPATPEEIIQQMKANLVRYSRNNDRRMVLRSLKDVKQLRSLSLDVVQSADGPLFDLEKELVEQNLLLNGVLFQAIGLNDGSAIKDKETSAVKNSCIPMLKALCRELCEKEAVKNTSSREIYEKLIVRLARTTSSADPYFRLNSLLGSPDLLVMPLNQAQLSMVSSSKGEVDAEPFELNMYEANGDIHVSLKQNYKFGLLRKSDVKSNKPWIVIDCIVTERSNLSRNQIVRQLKVEVPEIN
eukprot:Nitzschia sp. Nitz4//scaffold50_size126154//116580//117359//NITZ4_003706-RA/size126154-processed-gene-0.66-mRNA-1//-1//CDS//3329553761//7868//frame0